MPQNGFGRVVVLGGVEGAGGRRSVVGSGLGAAVSSPGRAFTCSALQCVVGGTPQVFFKASHPTQWPFGPR